MTTALVHSDAPPHANIVLNEKSAATDLLETCRKMHTADKMAEKRKSLFGKIALICGILGFLIFFVAVFTEITELLFVALALFVVLIVALILRHIFGRADVDDRKLDVVRRVLETLGSEIKKEPVSVMLDFKGYDRTSPVEKTTSWWSSTGQLVYKKTWLRMNFYLLDGTSVAIHATTHCKRKQRAKRKYTKKKDKLTDEVSFFFKVPRTKPLDPQLTSRFRQLAPPGLTCASAKVKPRMAMVRFRASGAMRLCGRGGWMSENLESLLDGRKVIGALIMSYRTTASG